MPIVQESSSILNGLDVSAYHAFSEDVIGAIKFFGRAINGVDDDVRLTNSGVEYWSKKTKKYVPVREKHKNSIFFEIKTSKGVHYAYRNEIV